MLNQMEDEYPRGARKQIKHTLKGGDRKDIRRKWLKEAKPVPSNVRNQ